MEGYMGEHNKIVTICPECNHDVIYVGRDVKVKYFCDVAINSSGMGIACCKECLHCGCKFWHHAGEDMKQAYIEMSKYYKDHIIK